MLRYFFWTCTKKKKNFCFSCIWNYINLQEVVWMYCSTCSLSVRSLVLEAYEPPNLLDISSFSTWMRCVPGCLILSVYFLALELFVIRSSGLIF